jgi:hypothetical protein
MFKSLTRLASAILLARRAGKTRDALGASLELRNVWIQGIITTAGANARVLLYSGARPPTGGTVPGQLHATLIMGTTLGTAANGVLNWDEAGMTQTNTNHVSGTPTWVRITKSGGAHVVDMSIPGDATFSGSVINGVDVALNPSTITAPNA